MKTFAMAAIMMLTTAATAFAHNNPGMRNDNHRKPTPVVVMNDHHNPKVRDHRRLERPEHNCYCKHCKKVRRHMEREMRRREAERRHMEAHRHHGHRVTNLRAGR